MCKEGFKNLITLKTIQELQITQGNNNIIKLTLFISRLIRFADGCKRTRKVKNDAWFCDLHD